MSAPTKPTVFVCGATGSQGGALAHQLRELQWSVHATTRNAASPAAQALQAAGVQLTQGDWDNLHAIKSAMAGCDKLFLCLLPDFTDLHRERRQAERILAIAKEAGVRQVVSSTTLGIFTLDDDREEITPDSFMARHLAGKKGVEDAVRGKGFDSWTLLRPSFLMANFLEPKIMRYSEIKDHGTWTTAMTPETRLALLDHVDVASFALAAFKDPTRYHDRAIGLASQFLTVQEALDVLAEAAGRPFRAIFMTDIAISERRTTSNLFTDSQISMRNMFRYIDMDHVSSVISPTTLEEFLKREGDAVRRTYPNQR